MYRGCREGKDKEALTMVLIEDVMMLLMMIEGPSAATFLPTKPTTRTLHHLQPKPEPTTTMAMSITKWVKEHSYARTIIGPLANRD